MNVKNILLTAAAGVLAATAINVSAQGITRAENNHVTDSYDKTQVQPQIRLNLEKNTEEVHFIRDNTDPYITTKVYVLKHADPYELRPYLRNVVGAKKISEDNTFVECIKYNDGTGMLIVSAEEDRFGPQPHGMGIDEIVKTLDQPKITSSSDSARLLYFPKYRSAAELATLIWNVGTTHKLDDTELQQGKDKVYADSGLNGLFFYVPKFSMKNIENMLKYYDQPILQASVKYTVYEIYAENDGKIGLDFQSWKNNDGADVLSVGGRYRSNWTATYSGGIEPHSGSNKTQFINFNPKWNSKYLDFLVSKGTAKVMTTGEIVVRNNHTGVIDKTTNVFYNKKEDPEHTQVNLTKYQTGKNITNSDFSASDSDGTTVSLNGTASSFGIVKINYDNITRYMLAVEGANFVRGGNNCGRQVTVTSFSTKSTGDWSGWTDDIDIYKGPVIKTNVGPGFGFKMYVTPQICRDSTSISLKVVNSSLIGWKSNGEPRIAKNNEVSTDIMLSNKGNRFVIGGLEKTTVVRSTSGVPYLRQIPGLGWLFSSESESNKKSQLVIVAECVTSPIDEPVKKKLTTTAKKITKDVKGAGKKMSKWGFDQYYIDK